MRLLIFSILFTLGSTLYAVQFKDSIKTYYQDGTFISYGQVATNAPSTIVSEAITEFIDQFRGDPLALFDWALKDVGRQKDDKHNDIILEIKQALFNKETGVGTIIVDILVSGKPQFKDVEISSKVTRKPLEKGGEKVIVDIYYSNALLKKAYGTFYVFPYQETKSVVGMEVKVRFGWFFNIFITKKMYREIIEFRLVKFLNNFKEEAERRQGLNQVKK